jgi:hypothetical protein
MSRINRRSFIKLLGAILVIGRLPKEPEPKPEKKIVIRNESRADYSTGDHTHEIRYVISAENIKARTITAESYHAENIVADVITSTYYSGGEICDGRINIWKKKP